MFRHMNGEVGGQQQQGGQQQRPPPQGLIAGHLHFWSFLALLVFMAALIGGIAGWNKTHPHQVAAAAELWCKPNTTVSLDGKHGARFSSISEAVKASPSFSSLQFCIHIRAGRYVENVLIGLEKTNLVFVGDGVGKTIIAANRTCRHCELRLATLLVRGRGFIAVDMTVENNEEMVNLAPVAVENWSDRSVFYRCSLRSRSHYVLRASTFQQFYRDCTIQGSTSLIYGAAQAFFQNCNITIDGTVKNVTYVVAEQSRKSPNKNEGFIFHMCTISANGDPSSTPVLGAAHSTYSRIAYLECEIDLKAAVWSTNGYRGGNIFFAEYGNTRNCSSYNNSSSDEVHVLDFAAASQLSLSRFFLDDWVPEDIPHKLDLVG